jgi:lysine 2-monooxygenase
MDSASDTEIDVAIIGGGVCGIYCAYRLAESRPHEAIRLYEMSDRFGGRLWSKLLKESGHAALEIGGMFFSDAHENTAGLIEHIGLRRTRVGWTSGHHYLRGHVLTDEMYSDPASIPYRLAPAESGRQPGALVLHALAQIVPDLFDFWPFTKTGRWGTPKRAARRLRAVRMGGRPLCDWGFWNLLSEVVSNEAIELLAATHGSASAFKNVNAYDAILTLLWEAHPGQSHFVVADGYQRLPLALMQASAHAVTFASRKRLVRIEAPAEGFRLYFETPAGEERVEAKAVILALPKRAIELIDIDETLADARFHIDLAAVSSVPACKAYLLFDKPWWSGAGRRTGRTPVDPLTASFTDQPIRQCYYFAGAVDGPGVLMTAFADDGAAAFWPALVGEHYADKRARQWLEDDDDSLRASGALIKAAQRQLQLMHPDKAIDSPSGALFFDWSADPYGGGWHAWAPYVRSWEVRNRIRRPNPRLAFHVCGEAFAQPQGWVEGGINNAEVMLEKHFGIPRPCWVRDDYELET